MADSLNMSALDQRISIELPAQNQTQRTPDPLELGRIHGGKDWKDWTLADKFCTFFTLGLIVVGIYKAFDTFSD